jgi:biopolymer transport protein ExbD
MARPLQEINAGSMADIAFLLLIFFVVVTTMDTNSGMQRRLPPVSEKENTDALKMKERNVMVVLINKDNKIAIKGNPVSLDEIYDRTTEFFLNPDNNINLPEKEIKEITFFGKIPVSKGVISLQTDRNTNYNKYLQVQNEISRAVNDLRNKLSNKKFGKAFNDLNEAQQKAVAEIYPIAISEAEPRKMLNTK